MINPGRITRDDGIQAYLAEALGIVGSKVIPSKENSPAPNDHYATYLEISNTPVGVDNTRADARAGDDTVLDFSVRGVRSVKYRVQTYRDGGADSLRRLLMYHLTPLGQLAIDRNGLVFRTVGDIKDVGLILSDEWEERFSVDITFWIADTLAMDINSLASASIIITSENGDTEVIVDAD